MSYAWLIFLHILLLVFWLGTDLGVFLAAKISEREDLGVETRATVLKLGMVLDRLPRTALTLILPSGLTLAMTLGLMPITPLILGLVWAFGGLWAIILWAGFLNPESPTEQRAMMINFFINAALALGVTGYASFLLMGDEVPGWLALKLLSVGLVFVAGVVLDVLFKPAVGVFMSILTDGANEQRDAAYRKAMRPVYWAVLAIYALVLFAAWLGIAKPPL